RARYRGPRRPHALHGSVPDPHRVVEAVGWGRPRAGLQPHRGGQGGACDGERLREELSVPRALLRRIARRPARRGLRELPVIAVRMVVSMVVAATVLLGGAWMGGAFAGSSASPSWTGDGRRPGEIPVGDDLVVSGQPMQL